MITDLRMSVSTLHLGHCVIFSLNLTHCWALCDVKGFLISSDVFLTSHVTVDMTVSYCQASSVW